jgi:hypothetical protein
MIIASGMSFWKILSGMKLFSVDERDDFRIITVERGNVTAPLACA